jgi:hypothetical protein
MASAPLSIEINYDAERELFGDESESPDARHLLVEIENRKLKPGTLGLGPPEDAPDAVVPIRIRPGTQMPRGNGIEFRAELDVDAISDEWGSVEDAAKQEHPILITAEEDTPPGRRKQIRKRRAMVSINLNSIRWKWTPLVRDDKGVEKEDGPTQENTPIEVKIDGTNNNGFRLELERMVWDKDIGLDHDEADFVHYLSPDHKCDFSILAPDPVPWEIPAKESQRQVITRWWTKFLPEDHEILGKPPVDTTIRVRAYPENSIQQHQSGGAPTRKPADAPMLATREIPLRLGVRKWKAEVFSPDPNEPPALLEGDRPWEDSLPVEINLFDDSDPDEVRSLKNEDVEWVLRPGSDGKQCGMVKYDQQKDLTEGTWKVNDAGRVEFRFCPTRDNALFLAGKEGLRFYAEFDIHLKGKDPNKKGPKIRSKEKPDDEEAPTLVVDWAPKFDLGIFKLPFFIKPEAPLDLEAEPNEEKAEPVMLTLTNDETKAYRTVFRTGGTIMLRPVVPWDAGESKPVEYPLQRYRLVVGDRCRKGEEKRQVIPVEPTTESTWPETVFIPARPGHGGCGATVQLKPQVPLHPDMAERFRVIGEKARNMDSAVAPNAGFASAQQMGSWEAGQFQKLSRRFDDQALRYFCETPSDKLCMNRKGIRVTLGAMASFLEYTQGSWDMLGNSIALHREIYKRYEDTLVNGYFDIFGFEPIKKRIEPIRRVFEQSKVGKYFLDLLFPDRIVAAGFQKAQSAVLKSRLAVWIGNSLDEVIQKNAEALSRARQALPGPEKLSRTAGEQFARTLRQCEQHATDVAGDVAVFVNTAKAFSKQLEELRARGLSGDDLERAILPRYREMQAAWSKVFETREKFRSSFKSAFGDFKATATTEGQVAAAKLDVELHGHNATSLAEIHDEYTKLLEKEELDPEAAKEFMDKVAQRPAPLAECQAIRTQNAKASRGAIDAKRDSLLELLKQHHAMWQGLKENYEALLGRTFHGRTMDPETTGQRFVELCERQIAPSVESSQAEATRLTQEAAEFSKKAQELADYKLDKVYKYWYAIWKTLEEKVEDQTNEGTAPFESHMDQLLHSTEPPVPTSSDLLTTMTEMVLAALTGLKKFIVAVLGALLRVIGKVAWALLWLVGAIIRGLLAFLTLLLTFVRSVLGKWAEGIASVFEWFREAGGGKFSSLAPDAFQAGYAVAQESQASPDLFAFTYTKEIDLVRRVKDMAEQFSKEPVWIDKAKEAIKGLFRTGYDDYYAGQLQASRAFFLRLCSQVLDRSKLEEPPIDSKDDAVHLAFVVADARSKIQRQIANYARSVDNAGKDQTGGFGASFWTEFKDQRGFNSVDLDILLSWVGWGAAWAFRIVGCFLACAGLLSILMSGGLSIPLAVGTVAGCFTAAELADFITATSRLMCGLLGYYPYVCAYPRDTVLLPAVFYAMVFKPAASKFAASKSDDIVGTSRIDMGY